jgi:ribose 1,5-bisphosphokinase PhnN
MDAALILIGAPGAGKSAVLGALSARLEADEVPHGTIESEQLAQGWPLLPASEWVAQLANVLERQRRAGRTRMLIAATVETAEELVDLVDATAAGRTLVACLVASPATVRRRIEAREPESWPGKRRLMAHASHLAEVVPGLPGIDLRVATDSGDAEHAAAQLARALAERGMLPTRP